MSLDAVLEENLAGLDQTHLRRSLRIVETGPAAHVISDQSKLLNFSSNDYLGLAAHPELKLAAIKAIEKQGWGAGASRLVCGNLRIHQELDEAIAHFKGTEAAVAFGSGYTTAVGSIPAVAGKGDVVILDKLCHACLIDGARLSGATVRVFPHNQMDYLEKLLRQNHGPGRTLIVTESIFSMDGDRAELQEMVRLKEQYDAWIMVDEAHATGIFGPNKRGLIDELGLGARVELQMGTLSKALGGSGGYIAGSRTLVDFLINRARSLIFSTAPPPAAAAAGVAALDLIRSRVGDELKTKLWRHIETFNTALGPVAKNFVPAQSPIIPIILGPEAVALQAAERLRREGLLVPAIRYPTVARGKARLRISLSAAHEKNDVLLLAEKIKALLTEELMTPNKLEDML
jgi:8-amino-7-oxononanoate synthase